MSGTISSQATPNGELARNIQKTVNYDRKPGQKLQVLEDGGQNIVSNLRVPDPFRRNGCVFGDEACIVRSDQKCDTAGVVYRITCTNCSS